MHEKLVSFLRDSDCWIFQMIEQIYWKLGG